ncbi:MAG TPA: prepilin-type N-terminal cleavage/methylation domain-containing protein [Candidatus Acidoferrum sp.]|jgi:prepilin-type N-terminal cleavage/methylation domain-containing protein
MSEQKHKQQQGFTLVEMMIATIVVLVGLVAVAQLVPASALLNAGNRNDGTALVFAQRELEFIREQPLGVPIAPPPTFSDPLGVLCPAATNCGLGDPAQPLQLIGSPVVAGATPIIDFSAAQVPGYGFTYIDPNDPFGASYDVRWAVITFTNTQNVTTGRRIILGVFRRGMRTPTLPITLDTMVEK